MDWASFVELLRTTFKDFDIPQVIQRAVVGGTLCTLVWLAVQFLVRPAGSIGWYRARTRELLRARHWIADDVVEAEAAIAVLKQQLSSLQVPRTAASTQRPSSVQPPISIFQGPSSRGPAALAQPPQEEEDPSDRHSWRRHQGGLAGSDKEAGTSIKSRAGSWIG